MDKTTTLLVRFTCGFIIFGGIFGALWRVSYVKNIERQEREEFLDSLRDSVYDRHMGNCFKENVDNDNWIHDCDKEWQKKLEEVGGDPLDVDKIPADKKLESLF